MSPGTSQLATGPDGKITHIFHAKNEKKNYLFLSSFLSFHHHAMQNIAPAFDHVSAQTAFFGSSFQVFWVGLVTELLVSRIGHSGALW